MKTKFLFLVFTLTLGLGSEVLAQYSGANNGLSYKVIGSWEGFDFDENDIFDFDGYDIGVEIGYTHAFSNTFGIDVPVQLGKADLVKSDGTVRNEAGFVNAGLLGKVQYFNNNRQFLVPWARAGLYGEYSETQDFRAGIPVGVGFDIRLGHHTYLSTGADYRFGFDEDNERMVLSSGLKILLGDGEPGQRRQRDRDKDGVPDELDQCPEELGLAELMGCPDRDGDKVADKDDACPEIAGLPAFGGCPDTDGDGIQDSEDECPEEVGPKNNNGCPLPDTDNDGLVDAEDKCPETAGPLSTMGCPDTDKDGIIDIEDECPNDKGPASNNGCPLADSDNDGVADIDDRCPELPGSPINKGCPDTDKDGIVDIDDKCPEVAGPLSNNGCPELEEEEKEVIQIASRSIEFETGSTTLKPSSQAVLDQVAAIMIKYPSKKARISGYTDSVGSETNNQKLSERRAKSCFDYLSSKGVSVERMTYAGYGESNPIADNNTAEGRAQNRRVVFDIVD